MGNKTGELPSDVSSVSVDWGIVPRRIRRTPGGPSDVRSIPSESSYGICWDEGIALGRRGGRAGALIVKLLWAMLLLLNALKL